MTVTQSHGACQHLDDDAGARTLEALVEVLTNRVAARLGARPPRLLSMREAGEVLGISHRTVQALVYSGRLASVKVGWRRLISERALEAFIETLERGIER